MSNKLVIPCPCGALLHDDEGGDPLDICNRSPETCVGYEMLDKSLTQPLFTDAYDS